MLEMYILFHPPHEQIVIVGIKKPMLQLYAKE